MILIVPPLARALGGIFLPHTMSNPYFRFKQFTVRHDRCAMKVGTDGCLLGAWADVSGARRIADVGTGSGLVALMLAQRNTDARIDALDIDRDACLQAAENVSASPFAARIRVLRTDFRTYAATAPPAYDRIVSNPPYLTAPDMQNLEEEVKYDPKTALYGGTDGLDIYRSLASEGGAYLKVGGHCIVEVGAGQARQVAELFTEQDFELVRIIKDYADTERHVLLRKKW